MYLIVSKRTSVVIALLIGLFAELSLFAQNSTADTSPKMERQLRLRLSVTWQGQQLGTVFGRLADSQGVAIWLDRRVDPQQTIDLRLADVSLRRVLDELTKSLSQNRVGGIQRSGISAQPDSFGTGSKKQALGFTVLGNVIYVGPERSARELQTLSKLAHDALKKVPAEVRNRWLQNEPSDWPRLSNPRAHLAKLLQDANLQLVGKDLIAHDLWEAKHLPRTSLVDRVVLILVGFDLTCHIGADGELCEVVPIKRPVVITREYKLPRDGQKLLGKLKQAVSGGQLVVRGRTILLTGCWEEHQRIQELLGSRAKKRRNVAARPTGKVEKKYSLQLQNQPVGAIIDQLAKQLNLDVEWDDASLNSAKISRNERISCQVKQVGLDELLNSVLSPAGLRFQREGRRVKITAEE